MIAPTYFRERRYVIMPGKVAAFNRFFLEWLLPGQVRHGALLVGRWQAEDERHLGRA